MANLLELREQIVKGLGEKPVLYDLGCGQSVEEGFIGIDFHSGAPDVQRVDLYQYPWPIQDATADYFRASHFVEHVPDWDAHFSEIYRCLKPGGTYEIIVPYYWNSRWAQDPDHKQMMVGERFKYLAQTWRKMNKIDHYGAKVNFEVIGWFELLNEDFLNQGFDDQYMAFARKHFINVIDDVAVVLRKLPRED